MKGLKNMDYSELAKYRVELYEIRKGRKIKRSK